MRSFHCVSVVIHCKLMNEPNYVNVTQHPFVQLSFYIVVDVLLFDGIY